MDDIKRPQQGRAVPLRPERRSFAYPAERLRSQFGEPKPAAAQSEAKSLVPRVRFKFKLSKVVRLPSPLRSFLRDMRTRLAMAMMATLIISAEIITLLSPYITPHGYALGTAETLLGSINQQMADRLKFDPKKSVFTFNSDYVQRPASVLGSAGPQIKALANQDPSKGISVTDPQNQIDFTLVPKFSLLPGKQDGNRVVYPLANGSGWLVYTMHTIGVKEDVLLNSAGNDTANFDYVLGLGSNLAARVLGDGSIGVFGNTLLSGNVATGTDKDAELLQKARQNAPKDTLLFIIPAPSIKQLYKRSSSVKATYSLVGDQLRVTVSGLSKAHYPLTIDPSIYVETAEKFMRGNNETNIDFDVADTLIRKGPTTGARFDSWHSLTDLPSAVWGAGTAAAGGFLYSAGGAAFNGQIFSTAGSGSYLVPSGVTTITVKAWGGGGGGGAGSGSTGSGGNGGGGGFAQADITVTPGETLSVLVGTGGSAGANSRNAGNGGGYSAVQRSSTFLVQAGGGGGGGGGNGTGTGCAGGAGGGSSGVAGATGCTAGSGGAGTTSAGGGGGTAGTGGTAGAAGVANAGGDGGGSSTTCSTSVTSNTGGAGGTGAGGKGGNAGSCTGGGGGGGGRFGGGGGGSANTTSSRTGGGGGGGSSLVTGANTTQTAGSGTTPGQSSDGYRNGAGVGGSGGTSSANNTAGTAGLVAIIVTGSATVNSNALSWAKFSTSDGTITSPDPGTGACAGWCSASDYNLPGARSNFSLVAYNGFLYALGGEDSNCTTGNANGDGGVCKTVYIAKLGANGEPRLWHPTDTNQANWVFWYRDTDLSSPRSLAGAVAYNNRLYLLGGKTSASGVKSVVTTVEEADITGTGTLSSWTTTGMVTLRDPANNASTLARYGFGAQVYNNHIYVIGGASSLTSGSPSSSVQYITINSNGTMAGNWLTTSTIKDATGTAEGKMTNGGSFTAVWGAYIYISGGCTAYNASGYCTTVASDTQLASINADGSLDIWNTNASVSDTRMGHNIVAWRNVIYEVGGCSAQDASTGACSGTLSSIKCGANVNNVCGINQDGDASTVGSSVASGTAPCSGGSPYSCNMPSSIGNVLNETAIMNGYLYIMGGCTNNACTASSSGITYQAIGSDGTLQKPATCTGTYTDSYCVSSSTLPHNNAAGATAIFNGRIYIVGGFTIDTDISYVTVNADGSLGTWNTADLTTIGAADVSYAFAYARANPSSAGTNPGNLFIFGGCTAPNVGCSGYTDAVYKCNISTTGAPSGCTTSGQLQIGAIPGGCGTGLGAMVGAVYANYIYLVGGLTPNCTDLTTARYAKFDNSNNVVTVGSGWVEGSNQTVTGRRRGSGFGYNGYLYVVGGYDGSGGGVLADIEFAKINVSDGSWGPFTVSSVTINQRWGLSVPVSNSFAYVVGGCTVGAAPSSCSTRTSTIQTFQVYNNDSGSPAGYSTTGACGVGPCTGASGGTSLIGGSAAVLNGYMYYAGGCTNMTCTTTVATDYYALINSDGTLGSWTAATANMPVARAWGKLLAAANTLYWIGGVSGAGSLSPGIQSCVSFSSGDCTSWTSASSGNQLPVSLTNIGAAVWNNRIYVVGGSNSATISGSSVQSAIYYSDDLGTGGTYAGSWTTVSSAFNVARSDEAVVTYANNLYILGGYDGSNYLNDVQYLKINSNGSLGSATFTTSLPAPVADADAFAANGYLYLIGGRSAATVCGPSTLVSPISANTSISSGNNPTGVGEWYQTNQRYSGDRYGAAAVYTGGKAYVIGGGCNGSFVGTTQRGYYTTVLSQPQTAQYSIMFDTDTDVFPVKWLLNGVDNSTGANWRLSYESMKNTTSLCSGASMTTWGQVTNFGNVTLGTPGVYTPLDGSGTNTNCARFFYLSITVDSSQAYGYPDDVSRGPTIADLTLEFTADPSKRLMHGRSFTGGLQQPDDTPF